MAIRAKVANNTVKARVGTQNVSRVLTNSTTPPSKLINLDDVNASLRTEDGMILVWDLPSQQFIMTSVIDSSSTTIEGIVYFTNTEESSSTTNGAVIVSGGVGIAKSLNVGLGLSVTGISFFGSDVDIDASVDILENLTVVGSTGLSTVTTGPLTVTGETNVTGDANIDGTLAVDGILSLTDYLFYDVLKTNQPNGIAYFDNTGKLITSPSSNSATDTSNYILTTQETTNLPIWTSTIDGGIY